MTTTQKVDLMLAFYIASLVATELAGGKIFTLFTVNASVAIFLYPLTFAIDDVITEVFGKERAKSFVNAAFLILLFLFGFVLLATTLPPAERFKYMNAEYRDIFGQSLRIIVASLTSFWLSENFDIIIFSKIRQKLGTKRLWLRTNLSNLLSEFIDTSFFMFLAFYAPGNTKFIVSLILPYWLLKCLMSLFETPIVYVGINWIKKGEKK